MNTGQILRAKSNSHFTIISNDLLKNPDLSYKAKGLLAYLLTLPPDWVINKTELVNHAKDGHDSIRTAFKELEEAGYIMSAEIRNEKGHFKGYNYIVYEFPYNEDPYDKPARENPRSVYPRRENPMLQITNNTKTNNTNNTPFKKFEKKVDEPSELETVDEQPKDKNISLKAEEKQTKKKVSPALALFPENIEQNKESSRSERFKAFLQVMNEITGKRFRGDQKAKRQFIERTREGYTIDDFKTAVENCKADEYHIKNPHFLTPEFITRQDKLERYLNAQRPKPKEEIRQQVVSEEAKNWIIHYGQRCPKIDTIMERVNHSLRHSGQTISREQVEKILNMYKGNRRINYE